MSRPRFRSHLLLLTVVGGLCLCLASAGQEAKQVDELADFAPLDKALRAPVEAAGGASRGVPAYLGVAVARDGARLIVAAVQAESPASKAGLEKGDVLMRVDGQAIATADAFRQALQNHRSGDKVRLETLRGDKSRDVTVALAATSRPLALPQGGPPAGTKTPAIKGKTGFKGAAESVDNLPLWKKSRYRLAVVVIDFADVKANPKATPKYWDAALFSSGSYTAMSATGQPVHGSLADYFREQSFGRLQVEGKVFAPVAVSKKRETYSKGSGVSNKTVPLTEALDRLIERDGADALKDFDGLAFLYAGTAVKINRGNLYYPHRGSLTFQGRRWAYLVAPEGGPQMSSISVLAPEFAKLLGLPELAARTENPGSEGLGPWCLMSNGAGQSGKPAHLSAWCKEQLGWLEPVVLDPAVKQKLILGPVQTSPSECVKLAIRPDGSEYFLLENRTARGFDTALPGQGLLIWRVLNNRPILEEAHGITGPSGPNVMLESVPYPSAMNNAFTPLTMPSSRSLSGGGLPVYLTHIRRLADGRVTFYVGYEYH